MTKAHLIPSEACNYIIPRSTPVQPRGDERGCDGSG